MVGLITALFKQGGIHVLVGTTSLLGEGWDAPSVNSLILASFVGSYMLSNQMRGRAIRTQEGNPHKTANIWHLVCQEQDARELNEDMETLARRFKSFVGVSFTSPRIASGLGRLGLGRPPYTAARMDHVNAVMQRRACDRPRLISEWEQALGSAQDADMAEQVAASVMALPRNFVFRNTLLALLWQGWFWGVSVFAFLMHSAESGSNSMTPRTYLMFLAIASALAALAALPKCIKALWLFFWHGPVASSMKQIGKTVLKAMVQAEIIETDISQLRVIARKLDYGFVGCSLQGGTTRERSIFLEALQEAAGPGRESPIRPGPQVHAGVVHAKGLPPGPEGPREEQGSGRVLSKDMVAARRSGGPRVHADPGGPPASCSRPAPARWRRASRDEPNDSKSGNNSRSVDKTTLHRLSILMNWQERRGSCFGQAFG